MNLSENKTKNLSNAVFNKKFTLRITIISSNNNDKFGGKKHCEMATIRTTKKDLELMVSLLPIRGFL